MKSLTKKLLFLAGLFLAFGQVSHATTGLSISSTTNIVSNSPSGPIPFIFTARPGESVTATLYSTAPLNQGCTVNFEYATNFQNWAVFYSSAAGGGGFTTGFATSPITINFPTVQQFTQFRWNILTSTNSAGNAVPSIYTIRDNDDTVTVIKNSKSQDSVYLNDDSLQVFGTLKPSRFQYQQSGGSMTYSVLPATLIQATTVQTTIFISSRTQFVLGQLAPNDRQYSVLFSTNIQPLETNFAVVSFMDAPSSSTMLSTPVISTQTAQNGDTLTFLVQNSTVAFNSDNISAGTGLKLGASTRSVQPGGILQLIYFNGFWRELFFANNNQ